MPKINREEYEILKGLDEKWKWIARDGESLMYGGELYAYTEMPQKETSVMWSDGWGSKTLLVGGLFQFIQWENEEPYNIAELIADYEKHIERKYPIYNDSKYEGLKKLDLVNQPNHYIGNQGIGVEDILKEFIPRYEDGYVAHRVSSAIEYLLRAPLKNGIQDIEKAKKNLTQALEYMEVEEMEE